MAVPVCRHLSLGCWISGFRVIAASVWRRLFWPALTTALMLALTLGLGIWQLQRLAWKSELLASIDRGEATPPLPLPSEPLPFRRYTVAGQFAKGDARYGAEVRQGLSGPLMGEQVIAILLRPGDTPVVIDRGWAPDGVDISPTLGQSAIQGYVRAPEHTPWMGATDDPARLRFYALDPAAIGAAFGYPSVAPFTLVAMGPPGTIPDPVQSLPRPPNDHLSYAVTWFSLSAALAVVFLVYARQTLRPGSPS